MCLLVSLSPWISFLKFATYFARHFVICFWPHTEHFARTRMRNMTWYIKNWVLTSSVNLKFLQVLILFKNVCNRRCFKPLASIKEKKSSFRIFSSFLEEKTILEISLIGHFIVWNVHLNSWSIFLSERKVNLICRMERAWGNQSNDFSFHLRDCCFKALFKT